MRKNVLSQKIESLHVLFVGHRINSQNDLIHSASLERLQRFNNIIRRAHHNGWTKFYKLLKIALIFLNLLDTGLAPTRPDTNSPLN